MAGGSAVGVDIGGTKLIAGLVDTDGTVLERVRVDTPARDPAKLTSVIVEAVAELDPDAVHAVGVGAAGIIDHDGSIAFAPNIDWVAHPFRSELRGELGRRVVVDNDANTAAIAEHRLGAGARRGSTLMLTLGTGVGGGYVIGDQHLRGASGYAAEFGHLIVCEGGPRCSCGNHGCLEAVASGTAIGRMGRERRSAGRLPDGSPLHDADPLDGRAVTQAAEAGDTAAAEILAEAGRWLGVGIAGLLNALDPSVVVVGGGAMAAGSFILPPAREAARARVLGQAHRRVTPIRAAVLGDDAGMIGAALLAMDGPRHPLG